jgi:hypothetical protein
MGEVPSLPPLGHKFGGSGTGIGFQGGTRPMPTRFGQNTNLNPVIGQAGLMGEPKLLEAFFNRLIGILRGFLVKSKQPGA